MPSSILGGELVMDKTWIISAIIGISFFVAVSILFVILTGIYNG